MPDAAVFSLASVLLVSLISLAGIAVLVIRDSLLKKVLLCLVGFSAGALLGDAFIHLLPEVVESGGFTTGVSMYVLSGMIVFFLIEKIVHWRHCHIPSSKSHPHPFAYMNLFGDAVHNFIDGMVIAASYLVSVPVGVATTIAVVFHEIPQEIGDFGVLIHGGFSRSRALALNFLSAVTAVIGAAAGLVIGGYAGQSITFLAAFAAGGFIYIAAADLIPELHKKATVGSSVVQLVSILAGIAVMFALLLLE